MANLTKGGRPQPYGKGGRKVVLPVKASAQLYEGAMLAEISGAVCTGTTAGAGNCIGIAEADALGGASDGTVRVSVWTDHVFIFKNGTNACSDATPYGSIVYMEDDNSVGTGGVGGTGEGVAGRFMGFEDDGRVRVYVGKVCGFDDESVASNAAGLTDTASQNVSVVAQARVTRALFASMSQNSTVTITTTGAVVGDVMRIVRTDTSAHTLTVVDGGTGTPTLAVLVASKSGWCQAYFNGTNWLFDGCSAT